MVVHLKHYETAPGVNATTSHTMIDCIDRICHPIQQNEVIGDFYANLAYGALGPWYGTCSTGCKT